MTNDHRGRWASQAIGAAAMAIGLIGMAAVEAQQAERPARKARGMVRDQGGQPLPKEKARPNAADPLGKAGGPADQLNGGAGAGAGVGAVGTGTSHFTFRLHAFDGAPLAASYYRSKLTTTAPVVILVHESGRSRKDFEEPVLELKGKGLAEYLQSQDYAVLTLDLRGQGQNPRRALARGDRPRIVLDLQAAYFFLLDRHNRGELNVSKLGIIGLGDGANLAAAWAHQPGAAVSTEGHPSDLSGMVLISPMPEGTGYLLKSIAPGVSSRVPMLLMAGERDNPSKDAIQTVRQAIERGRLNKIEMYPSNLHGYKFLRLEPKVTSALMHFLENSLKNRAVTWEPQYNLLPVAVSDIQVARHDKKVDLNAPAAEAAKPERKRDPNAPAPAAEAAKPERKRD